MDERRAVGQLAFVLSILLSLLHTPVVHAQEDSSEVAVVELYVQRDSPWECGTPDQWEAEPSLALEAGWLRRGFDTAQLMVLVAIDDGQTVRRTDVALFDEESGIVEVVDPCNETVFARFLIKHLLSGAIWLSTGGDENTDR